MSGKLAVKNGDEADEIPVQGLGNQSGVIFMPFFGGLRGALYAHHTSLGTRTESLIALDRQPRDVLGQSWQTILATLNLCQTPRGGCLATEQSPFVGRPASGGWGEGRRAFRSFAAPNEVRTSC